MESYPNKRVVQSHAPAPYDELVHSYESAFHDALQCDGSIYTGEEAMPPMISAAHERRIELLDNLPIGDVSSKVCVDYGVGSWGFACIYPKLQDCLYAIGIDVSYEAVKASAKVSQSSDFGYGENYLYLTSRGDHIDLESASVDIFFSGECIEHVENTNAFLDEICRVLKPGGFLILTTPNADGYLYKLYDEQYGVGPEHVALMSYDELCQYLEPRFEILTSQGFNNSLHHSLDDKIEDQDFAKSWATQHLTRPDLATGLIIMAQRRKNYLPKKYKQNVYHHSSQEVIYGGKWSTVPLHRVMTGKLSESASQQLLSINFDGIGIIINFWCHDWSGIARISVDNDSQDVNLYSPLGGFKRVCINGLSSGKHQLKIQHADAKDWRSQGNQLIFYQAISYKCEDF